MPNLRKKPAITDRALRRKCEEYVVYNTFSHERRTVFMILVCMFVAGLFLSIGIIFPTAKIRYSEGGAGGLGGMSAALFSRWKWGEQDTALFKEAITKYSTLCTECAYDLRGSVSAVCSECGEEIKNPERISEVTDEESKDENITDRE